jgi:hypothetical protein
VNLGPPVPWATGSLVAVTEPLLIERDRLVGAGPAAPLLSKSRLWDVVRIAREGK